MYRVFSMILSFALASSAGCQGMKRADISNPDEYAKVTFQVDGMMKAKSGATWMGWPNAVTASLEGINGTKRITWDFARDLVTVHYDPSATGPNVFRAAISELGYDAKASSRGRPNKAASKQLSRLCVPPSAPKFFVDAIEKARAARRPIIVDFWAEWCAACLQLKRETLGHPDVVKALSEVELIYVDLDKFPALGEAYGVVAIPDLFFIDRSGRIVDRLQNIEPPAAFVARVSRVFALRGNRGGGDK